MKSLHEKLQQCAHFCEEGNSILTEEGMGDGGERIHFCQTSDEFFSLNFFYKKFLACTTRALSSQY